MISDKKAVKKEKILDEGIRLFMRRGYHGTGVKEILDNVKVPKGSFYAYFNSKEDFVANAITHYITPFIEQLSSYLDDPELTSYEALKIYFHSLIENMKNSNLEGGCLLGDMMGELTTDSKIGRESLLAAVDDYCSLIEAALLSAQKQGAIRTDLPANIMASLLFNNWQGALLRMKLEQSIEPLNEFYKIILEDYILTK